MAHPLATSTDEEARDFCREVAAAFPRHAVFTLAATAGRITRAPSIRGESQ